MSVVSRRAVVMCQVLGHDAHVRGYASVAAALAAAGVPCGPRCEQRHVVAWAAGVERVPAVSRWSNARDRLIVAVRIVEPPQRVRPLAAELARLYKRVDPPPVYWPRAGGGLNGPLRGRPVPVQGW